MTTIGTLVTREDIIGIKKPVTFACVGKHNFPKFAYVIGSSLKEYMHRKRRLLCR